MFIPEWVSMKSGENCRYIPSLNKVNSKNRTYISPYTMLIKIHRLRQCLINIHIHAVQACTCLLFASGYQRPVTVSWQGPLFTERVYLYKMAAGMPGNGWGPLRVFGGGNWRGAMTGAARDPCLWQHDTYGCVAPPQHPHPPPPGRPWSGSTG